MCGCLFTSYGGSQIAWFKAIKIFVAIKENVNFQRALAEINWFQSLQTTARSTKYMYIHPKGIIYGVVGLSVITENRNAQKKNVNIVDTDSQCNFENHRNYS